MKSQQRDLVAKENQKNKENKKYVHIKVKEPKWKREPPKLDSNKLLRKYKSQTICQTTNGIKQKGGRRGSSQGSKVVYFVRGKTKTKK